MTDNEIRIAIAEKCPSLFRVSESNEIIWSRDGLECDCDLLNDLNAVREAEQVGITNANEADSYIRWLHILCLSPMPFESMPLTEQRGVIRSTARQRCEALLRTWGLWKD